MSLVKDNSVSELQAAITAFDQMRPSLLIDHGKRCCSIAREWFRGMDSTARVHVAGFEVPAWLQDRFQWGPVSWPISWCEVANKTVVDCGVYAALARECLRWRGIDTLPVQTVLVHNADDVMHWKLEWERHGARTNWICGRLIYHEAIAVVQQGSARVWDSTRGTWLDPVLRFEPNCTAAIRIMGEVSEVNRTLWWHEHDLVVGVWKNATSK